MHTVDVTLLDYNDVITDKTVSAAATQILNCIVWSIYGIVLADPLIYVVNIFGILTGVVQFMLLAVFRRSKSNGMLVYWLPPSLFPLPFPFIPELLAQFPVSLDFPSPFLSRTHAQGLAPRLMPDYLSSRLFAVPPPLSKLHLQNPLPFFDFCPGNDASKLNSEPVAMAGDAGREGGQPPTPSSTRTGKAELTDACPSALADGADVVDLDVISHGDDAASNFGPQTV